VKKIFKYDLRVTDVDHVKMPDGAQIIHVDWQGPNIQQLQLWAVVDPDAPLFDREFRVIGTGHPIADLPDLQHIGTVVQPIGLVWHVFEVIGQQFHKIRQALA
jgi:hypothetical protein